MVLTDEEMEEHLLWTRLNPDLIDRPHGIRCLDIGEYLCAIEKRMVIRELKAIFEIRAFDYEVFRLTLKGTEEECPACNRTMVFTSSDPFGRLFRTTYDKETGEFGRHEEIKGTEAKIVVFKGKDDKPFGALFLKSEMSIIPWERAVTAIPLLGSLWKDEDDTKHREGDCVD